MLSYVEPDSSCFDDSKSGEQFIIKRTEVSDLLYFANEIASGSSSILSFVNFFKETDVEKVYETSYFSTTVADIKNENQLVGIFFFNDSPFTLCYKEDNPRLPSPGMWEDWYLGNFHDYKQNGKNSLFLVYFLLNENYTNSKEYLHKIFHKVHLSLYTTLPMIEVVMFCVNKNVNDEIQNTNFAEIEDFNSVSAFFAFRSLVDYIYTRIPETENNNTSLSLYITRREDVFLLIEVRIGRQEDHDDLENIFKSQTPNEISTLYEDFFIAKMIAHQDENNKVLVAQVNDNAIGMLAVSTDVNLPLLIKSFELDAYDNLLKQDYMKAVKLKRKMIHEEKEKFNSEEKQYMIEKYKQEILRAEKISQRIYLQVHIKANETIIDDLDEVEKNVTNKDELSTQKAHGVVMEILNGFEIVRPDLDSFDKKLKIDSGSCLLTTPLRFFLDTLELFGLPKGYMEGNGHWTNWQQTQAIKREAREMQIKKLNKNKPKTLNRFTKKENDELALPSHFDFSPLAKAMRLFKNASMRARTVMRRIIRENKDVIANFFVNEEGDPSELKCFDIMSLKKKLSQAKIDFPSEYGDFIGPMLLCFGDLNCVQREVMRVPQEEVVVVNKKDNKKNNQKKEQKKKNIKEKEEQKPEAKPVPTTVYEVSISDFFKAVETSFQYDRLIYELNISEDDEFKIEYEDYMKMQESADNHKFKKDKSEYEVLRDNMLMENIEDSQKQYDKYSSLLRDFNEDDIPPSPPEVLNAFCTKLFFIEQAFESRSGDFLMQAFDCFPDRDYLIVTQPHSYSENSLLSHFIKVDKKINTLFNEVLYIIHRESLLISLLKISHANKQDLIKSSYLFENLGPEGEDRFILANEAILNGKDSKFNCVTAKINDHNIGIFLISKEVNVEYYDSHFNIREYSNLVKISKYMQGRIIFFLIHKNFVQHTKLMFKEIARLLNKITLFYELSPNVENFPKFIKEVTLLRNRRFPQFIKRKYIKDHSLFEDEKIKTRTDRGDRNAFDEEESDKCLVVMTKKMLAESRIANNNRIVVVGGSDTGISFIESLLSIRYLEFAYIYLIAPGGLLYHHIEEEIQNLKVSMNNYQIKELKRLILEHRIKIINAKVLDIKPSQKYIQLDDFTVLNYDYLILTLGLQDRLWSEFNSIVHRQIDEVFKDMRAALVAENPKDIVSKQNQLTGLHEASLEDFKKVVISVDDPYLYEKFHPLDKKIASLRKNPKNKIILYGRSVNLLSFIQGLLNRGVPADKIKLIIPNILEHLLTREEKIRFRKELLNISEEQIFVNGTTFEDTKDLEEHIHQSLESKGIKVLHNYNFIGVNLDENQKVSSYRFLEDSTNDKFEDLTASVIVTGGLLDVDYTVFNFIHENRLVYNGRAIIDKNFMTADSCIFAAGRLCEFSQRYSFTEKLKLMRLESYNSREIGYTLAKSFLQNIDNQLSTDGSFIHDNKIPKFFLPLPMGCYLPDNMLYYKVRAVKELNSNILDKEVNRAPIIFNTLQTDPINGCYLKFSFTVFGMIESITYYGKLDIAYHSIISLVGLHENYLNELFSRYDVKIIEDIPEFLSENWAAALFQDNFSKLVIKLKTIIEDEDLELIINNILDNNLSLNRDNLKMLLNNVSETTTQKLEMEILSFLEENKNHLPFYYIPAK